MLLLLKEMVINRPNWFVIDASFLLISTSFAYNYKSSNKTSIIQSISKNTGNYWLIYR